MTNTDTNADGLWYKDAIFYEINVRGFYDSNADGIGDLPGLTDKLDYLQWLGVTCLWLLPLYPSPLRDGGYDVADYRNILPAYGTLDDFKNMVDEAHKRGIRVLIDLVLNHTSDQHPWFQSARRTPDSPHRDWYVWSETDQHLTDARIIFTDTERSNWTWDEQAGAFYWHRFFSHQPDLNYENPEVHQAMLDVVSFWLDLGVDGFRLDAVPYLYECEGTNCENLPATHDFLKKLRAFIDVHFPGRVLLAEANQWPEELASFFGAGDECHLCFNFPIMPRLYIALHHEDRRPLLEMLRRTLDIPAEAQWGLFLRNHDELTLEMVTEQERELLYHEYAPNPRMKLNVGIRRRLAPLLDNGMRRIELLHAIIFALPGSPFIYYGDEIGMGDNIYLNDRDGVRTPMQWSVDRNAGFSRAEFAELYFPPIMDPVYGFQAVNVEAQRRHSTSLLHWMRGMIALRQRHPVFGRGEIELIEPENKHILAFIRRDDRETILCVYNLARSAQPVALDLAQYTGKTLVEMQSRVSFPEVTVQPYQLTFNIYGFYWFLLV